MTLDVHSTALTRFVDTNGIRCTYRRLGEEVGITLLSLQRFQGGLDHRDTRGQLAACHHHQADQSPPRGPQGSAMANNNYTKDGTALLFVGSYNDFSADEGKMWPYIRDVTEEVGPHDNLRAITAAAHKASIRVFIVPHDRWEPGDLEGWNHPNPDQLGGAQLQVFAKDSRDSKCIPISLRS
jgi:hypothetical protein